MEENWLIYRYCLYHLLNWVIMNVLLMMKMMKLMTLNWMFTFNDDSETDSEEIVSDSETSDDDEEINTQPTHSNSIANKEIT